MLELITGSSGSGKTTLLFRKIRKSVEDGRKVIIIVPEQYSYEFDRSLYKFLGASLFNSIESHSFTSLSRALFQQFGEDSRTGEYADEFARMILSFQAIDSAKGLLSFFGRQCEKKGFAEQVMQLITDMKRSGITTDKLRKLPVTDTRLAEKVGDIVEIYMEYDRFMEEYGFKDALDNVRLAADTAGKHRYFKDCDVFLDEFESFTGDQIDMLRVILSQADTVSAAFRTDNIGAGKFTLFETVNDTCLELKQIAADLGIKFDVTPCTGTYRFQSPDLAAVSEQIMRNISYDPENAPEPRNVSVFEAKDMYSECEYVCAAIRRLISESDDLKYSDIAVLSNTMPQYAEILSAAFRRYDIPFFLSSEKTVSHTPLMSFFTCLLDILTAKNFRTEHILRLIKCGILEIPLEDCSLLENYCYKWGIEGKMWGEHFIAADDDLERLEKLRSDIIRPLKTLRRKVSKPMPAVEICKLIYGYIDKSGAEKSIGRLMYALIQRDRDFEAAEQKRLWTCLMQILDSIASTLADRETDIHSFSRLARSMIARTTYSVPPQTLDSVTAASARTARLSSPKVVFVMGACDGDFPNQVSLHGLFSEADKQVLTQHKTRISRPLSELIASERLIVYKAMSSASHRLFVSYPLSDTSGQEKYRAQPVDQLRSIFGAKLRIITEEHLSPGFYAVTPHAAFYHYMLSRSDRSSDIASIELILSEMPEYSGRIESILSRSILSKKFTVAPEIMQKLRRFDDLRLSASAVEDFYKCPFMHFCKAFLRLYKQEKVDLDASVSGTIAHECMEQIISHRTKSDFIALTAEQIQAEIRSIAEHHRDTEMAGDFGKTARFRLLFDKLTERLTTAIVFVQHSLMASDFVPTAFELNINRRRPLTLRFAPGRKLTFGGVIDRVDVCGTGGERYVRIMDYKSSRKELSPVYIANGLNLQMLLYLFAVTDEGGSFSKFTPAGTLYSPFLIKKVEEESTHINEPNESAIRQNLTASGLVLGRDEVAEAMEHGVEGKFVPVKKNRSGEYAARQDHSISGASLNSLREFTYDKLRNMALTLMRGEVPAAPFAGAGMKPCNFCDYGDICAVTGDTNDRHGDPEAEEYIRSLLDDKHDKKEDNSDELD